MQVKFLRAFLKASVKGKHFDPRKPDLVLSVGMFPFNSGTYKSLCQPTIKDRNGMDLTKAEDTKKRWQEYTE